MKRILAILLSVLMLSSLVTVAVSAEEAPPLVKKILFDFEESTEGVAHYNAVSGLSGRKDTVVNSGTYSYALQTSKGVWDKSGKFVTSYTGAGYMTMAIPEGLNIKGDVGFAYNSAAHNTSSYVAFGVKLADGTVYFEKYGNHGKENEWHNVSLLGVTYYNLADSADSIVLEAAHFADDAENRVVEIIIADGGTGDNNEGYACYVDDVYYETEPALCTVSIDGFEVDQIYEGQEFTFPETDGVEKYSADGETFYNPGDTYTITEDIDFLSVYRAITEDDFSYDADFEYTGEAIIPGISSEELTEEIDYTVVYPDSKNVGTYQIVIKGKDHYYGEVILEYSITAHEINDSDFTFDLNDKEYTGEAITVDVESTLDETDYTVAYENNTNVGLANIIITAQGDNCTGTFTKTFNITQKTITEDDFTIADGTFIYNGEEHSPAVSSDLDEENYEVTYENNVNAGTATITITGQINCTGEVKVEFDIAQKAIDETDFMVDTADQEFTGEEITLAYDTNLTEDDYTVSYENNTNVGEATIIFTGKGNYTGEVEYTFNITAKALTEADFEAIADVVYNGQAQTPNVVVANSLITADDYTVAYENNTNAGEAKVVITGKGNFAGEITLTFNIAQATLKDADLTFDLADKVYTGSAITPAVTCVYGNDNIKVTYEANTNVGVAKITVEGANNCTGKITKEFKITPKAIAEADFTVDTATVKYTGKAITKAVTSTLPADAYTVAYENNTNVGTAKVVITAKGNYTGKIEKTFSITVPSTKAVKKVTAKAAKKSIKVSWKKVKGANGYAIEVSTSKKFKKKNTKTVFVKAKALKKTVKKLKAGKKYYVRVASFVNYKNDEGKTIKALSKWKKVKKAVKIKK